MTGRPPLPLGTWGRVRRYEVEPGRWRAVAQYRDHDGHTRQVERHSPVGKVDETGAKAERALIEHLRDRNKAAGGEGIKPGTTVGTATKEWLKVLDARTDRKARTKDTYRDAATRYVIPALGGVRLSEVSVQVADRFIRKITTENGPGAAKHAKVVLSAVMASAARYGAVQANPVRDTDRITGDRKVARSLPVGDLTKLMAALRSDARAVDLDVPDIIAFMAGTGVRIGEALALRFTDLDLVNAAAEISGTMIYTKATGTFRQAAPKSRTGHRVIALPVDLVAMLTNRAGLEWPHNEMQLVFPNQLGRPRDAVGIRRELRRVAKAAGIDGVTPHAFRRTVATKLDQAGLSPRQVADHLGHAQVSMTTDHYIGRKIALPEAAAYLSQA